MKKNNEKALAITTTMEKWNDIVSFNQLFLSHYIFRGQADANWDIVPALNRLIKNLHSERIDPNTINIYEGEMLREFKYKFPMYPSRIIPDEKDNVEWLTLMQHYGAPTRLLDFTNSLFVALYMALDNSYRDNCAIWAVNKSLTEKQHAINYCKENNCTSIPTLVLREIIKNKANTYIGMCQHKDITQEILPIYPKLCNERLAIQQGLFLMSSDLQVPFSSVFKTFLDIEENQIDIPIKQILDYSYTPSAKLSPKNIALIKLIIPRKFKWQLTKLLLNMNITAETLYPGLSGLAKSVGMLRLRDPFLYTD